MAGSAGEVVHLFLQLRYLLEPCRMRLGSLTQHLEDMIKEGMLENSFVNKVFHSVHMASFNGYVQVSHLIEKNKGSKKLADIQASYCENYNKACQHITSTGRTYPSCSYALHFMLDRRKL